MGGEGVHIVETRMFCTVCLKPSCLLICFHFWNLDLSQTLKQTIQILKEEKTGPKPWKKITPCHLSSFSSDPLHGSFFFCFLEVFATLAQERHKTHGKTKNKKINKQKLPDVTCPASPQTLSMGRFFFVLSRFLPLCQSNNISC